MSVNVEIYHCVKVCLVYNCTHVSQLKSSSSTGELITQYCVDRENAAIYTSVHLANCL